MLEDKIKNYITKNYGSIRQFSKKIDLPYTTVNTILKRGIDNSNVKNVIKIFKKLGFSLDKSLEENDLIKDKNKISNLKDFKIPVFKTIKAGTKIEEQKDILEYINITNELINDSKNFFAYKISDDSMYPKYNKNDIVVFEQNNNYDNANQKDCTILINNNVTFKNITINDDGMIIAPLNLNNSAKLQPIFYTIEEIKKLPITILGIAKEKRTRL